MDWKIYVIKNAFGDCFLVAALNAGAAMQELLKYHEYYDEQDMSLTISTLDIDLDEKRPAQYLGMVDEPLA